MAALARVLIEFLCDYNGFVQLLDSIQTLRSVIKVETQRGIEAPCHKTTVDPEDQVAVVDRKDATLHTAIGIFDGLGIGAAVPIAVPDFLVKAGPRL